MKININLLISELLGTLILTFVFIYTQSPIIIGITIIILMFIFNKYKSVNFNPAITLILVLEKKISNSSLIISIIAQVIGALIGLGIYRFIK